MRIFRKKQIQASFYFRDKKQYKQWKRYLIEVEETQQEAIRNLIDDALDEAKAMNAYLKEASEYEEQRMK